jgi:DNA-binding response OmpR family regulator
VTKILIVDEDTDVLRLLRVKLNAAGYEVSRARDGKEALAQAEKDQPEIVITELLLPDLHGLDLVVQLKTRLSPTALILILSSAGTDEVIVSALAAGAADYVSKPFSPQLLLERIRVNRLRSVLAQKIGELE